MVSVSTPDRVESRLGVLEFDDGAPSEETAALLYDHLDFIHGVEAFLRAIPGASLAALRRGFQSVGVEDNSFTLFPELMDSASLFLTANSDTVYCWGFVDLSDGPMVIDIPPLGAPTGILGTNKRDAEETQPNKQSGRWDERIAARWVEGLGEASRERMQPGDIARAAQLPDPHAVALEGVRERARSDRRPAARAGRGDDGDLARVRAPPGAVGHRHRHRSGLRAGGHPRDVPDARAVELRCERAA